MSPAERDIAAEAAELRAASDGVTLPSMFAATVAARGDAVALRQDHIMLTWSEYADQVAQAAGALAALGLGRGDTAVLMLGNVIGFHVADLALSHLGVTPISLYNSSAVEQIGYMAGHAKAKAAIVAPAHVDRVLAARASLPDLEHVVVIEHGDELLGGAPADLAQIASAVGSDDLATVIYTSGATGPPKGVMLTHRNIAWQTAAMAQRIEHPMTGWRQISYLPMAHIGERMMGHYLAIRGGTEVTCCPDPTQVAGFLDRVRPQMFLGMPRMWEKLQAELTASGAGLDAVGLDEGRVMLTGGGVLGAETHAFFRERGLPLSDIYGMSESTGPIAWSPHDPRLGCVGHQMPGCEVRIEPDGEILFRSGIAFAGYLNDPERTAEAITPDGWVRTGDVGGIDEASGQLKILDRKKELIVTAGGKNVSPANLESALKAQPLIAQAAVIGEQRRFVSALLVLDPLAVAAHEGASLEEAVAEQVAAANSAFSQAECVRRFTILDAEWLPDSDELTPTAKLKRRSIERKYAAAIEAMYATEEATT